MPAPTTPSRDFDPGSAMTFRLLHTSDWHVGKGVRGRSRLDEHREVLAEIAEIARDRRVDAVVIAGDLTDAASPPPEVDQVLYHGLLELAQAAPTVIVISGNHDHPGRLAAVAPLLALGRITVVAYPTPAQEGGVMQLTGTDGDTVSVALLPFVSQRSIVRADQLMSTDPHDQIGAYRERYGRLLGALRDACDPAHPAVLVAHAFVAHGQLGGGERAAHFIDAYAVDAPAFGASWHYVALGHIHRAQKLPGGSPLHYCGAPLQLDFGDTPVDRQVNLVELRAGVPAKVEGIPLRSGRSMITVRGTLEELRQQQPEIDPDAWIRAVVTDPARAGLADDVRDLLGERCVDVMAPRVDRSTSHAPSVDPTKAPSELFAEYLASQKLEDPRIAELFSELYEGLLDEISVGG